MQRPQQNNQGHIQPMQQPQMQPGAKRTRINLTNVRQLIDVNEHSTNFEASFRVLSDNKAPFQALVVSQTMLDNTPNLPYKQVNDGQFSGSISENSGVYQNYFIVLKADTPCVCDVEIVKKELPNTPLPTSRITHNENKNKSVNWGLVILIVGGLAVAGVLGYMFFIKNKSEDTKSNMKFNGPDRQPNRPVNRFQQHTARFRRESPAPSASPPRNNPLLDKLRNINF